MGLGAGLGGHCHAQGGRVQVRQGHRLPGALPRRPLLQPAARGREDGRVGLQAPLHQGPACKRHGGALDGLRDAKHQDPAGEGCVLRHAGVRGEGPPGRHLQGHGLLGARAPDRHAGRLGALRRAGAARRRDGRGPRLPVRQPDAAPAAQGHDVQGRGIHRDGVRVRLEGTGQDRVRRRRVVRRDVHQLHTVLAQEGGRVVRAVLAADGRAGGRRAGQPQGPVRERGRRRGLEEGLRGGGGGGGGGLPRPVLRGPVQPPQVRGFREGQQGGVPRDCGDRRGRLHERVRQE
mmetsp:Transcript_7570/g.26657  ORF Transcript_7570/g.26657 Transcript_7570/m.26657 type:complete len:290 (-) Transcript_7570:291-1160(-)